MRAGYDALARRASAPPSPSPRGERDAIRQRDEIFQQIKAMSAGLREELLDPIGRRQVNVEPLPIGRRHDEDDWNPVAQCPAEFPMHERAR